MYGRKFPANKMDNKIKVSIDINDFQKKFTGWYGNGEVKKYFSPGRVNIIGEHLDYNGGFVFPAAISYGIYACVRFNDSENIRMRSLDFKGETVIDLKQSVEFNRNIQWSNYPAGVIKLLQEKGHVLKGADILFASTLPPGSGLSSSACIEVLTAFIMISDKINCDKDRISIAQLCQKAENEFIGVQCGIMDQFSIALGRKDNAILLNTDTLEFRHVHFRMKEHSLVIMNSNKPRRLADSKYNERLAECAQAVEFINRKKKITKLAEAEIDDLDLIPDPVIKKRARHVITENKRVIKSVDILNHDDIITFGSMMTDSHLSLKNDYEVTGFELDSLVESAIDSPGSIGARMTGAGFGGCAIALVKKESTDIFMEKVSEKYQAATGLIPVFYAVSIADGVNFI
jgi:galactokinase